MNRATRCFPLALLAAGVLLSALPGDVEAQARSQYENVLSANPFLLLMEWFNAEYERAVTDAATVGVSMATISRDNDDDEGVRYSSMDLIWRYYPQGIPFDGWSFGASLGVTRVSSQGTHAGIGFDVNRSWLMGANDNFYIGVGIGLKRLLGASFENDELVFIPTLRLVNVGFAF